MELSSLPLSALQRINPQEIARAYNISNREALHMRSNAIMVKIWGRAEPNTLEGEVKALFRQPRHEFHKGAI